MPTVTAGPPTLHVPSLGIAARLTASEVVEGEYAVPRDPTLVGVHRSGVRGVEARLRPGPGVLLMSGHVAVGDTRGALWSLHALAPGDPLVVTGPTGTRRWHAEKLEVVRADQLPQDLLRGSGPERLVLVTCSGPVVLTDGRRAYRDNLVVTAVPA
ncbi:class F sortase [Mariniluteicoccus endophyticus]